MIARPDQLESLQHLKDDIAAGSVIEELSANQMLRLNPMLRPNYATAGILDIDAYDIDVSGLHQGFLRLFKEHRGVLATGAEVNEIAKTCDGWLIDTRLGQFVAPVVVNAAGAWADEINTLAGFAPVGLVPKRRTMVIIEPPEVWSPENLPMTIDIDEQFFLKPEAGQLLLSPADETPSPPCDAQPEEVDIAIGVDRIETAFDLSVRKVKSSWAGLRSFVADGVPAVGFLPGSDGFFLLAGQGGYGIQTSPALSQLAVALITGAPIPAELSDQGIEPMDLSPSRFTPARIQGMEHV